MTPFSINFRREKLMLRFSKPLIIAGAVTILLGAIFSRSTHGYFGVGAYLLPGVLLWLVGASFLGRSGVKLLMAWVAIGESLETFPETEEERQALREWSFSLLDHRRSLANNDFAWRQHALALVKDLDSRKPSSVIKATTPSDLLAERKKRNEDVAKWQESLKCARLDLKKRNELAEESWAKYLFAWDLFTKEFPVGLGILVGPEYKNPKTFLTHSEEKLEL